MSEASETARSGGTSGSEALVRETGAEEGKLGHLYRQLSATDARLRRLEGRQSPYTRVEAEMLRRRHDVIAERIRMLVERRRKA